MLKLFERNTVVQVAIILLVTALLWVKAFANPQPMPAPEGFAPLYSLLWGLGLPATVTVVIALVLVLVGGLFFNIKLSDAGLVKQNSLFPTLLFIIFMSAGTPTLSPTLLAVLAAIPFVNRFFLRSSHMDVAPDKVFGGAALIGIASMMYLPALTLIVAYILIAVNHRLYGWRNWMMFLLGLLAPYLLLWSILLFTGGLSESFAEMGMQLSTLSLNVGTFTTLEAIANGFLLAVLAVSLLVVALHIGENNVFWQKNATTVMLLAVAALATLPFGQVFPTNLQLFALPFTFCLDYRLFHTRRRRTSGRRKDWRSYSYDLLFILVIISALAC